MKRIIKDYLSFTRNERIAVMVLIGLMALFISLPYYYEPAFEEPVADSTLMAFLAAGERDSGSIARKDNSYELPEKKMPARLFRFDPNKISESGWEQLGISARTAGTIERYRTKGGRFKTAADLRKIWGMKPDDAARLEPYVMIDGAEDVKKNEQQPLPRPLPGLQKQVRQIDINLAGTEEWKSLPGIGEVLAGRIVRYREKCGGFNSVDAVAATYGIADTLFASLRTYLRFDERTLPKTDLNQAGPFVLKNRLCLSYQHAKAIVRYREEHGAFSSVDQLNAVAGLPDSILERLKASVRLH